MPRLARLARELKLLRRAFRNWASVAIAGLLWRQLPLPRRELTVLTRGGSRIAVPLGPRAGALYPVLEVFAFAEYAHDWVLEDEACIVDVGAHVGSFTLWLAERYPRMRAVCFEPDPDAFAYLERNTGGIAATLHRRAVGASGGTGTLHRPIAGGGVSSLQATAVGDEVGVEVVSFEQTLAGLGDVSLLKLDCEGCEYELVLGTPPAPWRRVQRVVLEYHTVSGHDPSQLVERLGSLGLRLVSSKPHNGVGTYWFSR
jgi:FkbM family methyltransferase